MEKYILDGGLSNDFLCIGCIRGEIGLNTYNIYIPSEIDERFLMSIPNTSNIINKYINAFQVITPSALNYYHVQNYLHPEQYTELVEDHVYYDLVKTKWMHRGFNTGEIYYIIFKNLGG
jgi:hypothetical protein